MVISGDYTHSFFLSNPKDLCQKSPIWKLGCDHVVEVKQKTHKSELGAAKKDWWSKFNLSQAQQERLSFIHSQGSSEDHEYDQVLWNILPQTPIILQVPLPQPPPRSAGKLSGWEGGRPAPHQQPSVHSQTHLAGQEWDQVDEAEAGRGTVRRKTKRREEARRNHAAVASQCNNMGGRRSKSRSKSRSPGREIERAIVIVHHTTCSHSRTASPDNLSESSISFHENEVPFDLSPTTSRNHGTCSSIYHGGSMEPCVSVAREPTTSNDSAPSCRTMAATALQFSNWESCRESWFSSGSEPRPSSGSDCPPRPPSFGEVGIPPIHFIFHLNISQHYDATLPRWET